MVHFYTATTYITRSYKMNEELKKALLNIAEDHAVQAIDDVYKLADVYVKSTENPWDDQALKFLEGLKETLVKLADKIDGEEG